MTRLRYRFAAALLALVTLAVTGCGGPSHPPTAERKAADEVERKAVQRSPYLPKNDVEFHNYTRAQEIYDDPTNILWCTFSFNNPSSPLVTVPVTGKLTSSSTTFFSPDGIVRAEVPGDGYGEVPFGVGSSRSVDGLFHPNPPQYRYGFTPGGAYVDFFNLQTYCSNKPTKFQRQSTEISLAVDGSLGEADRKAQQALANGNPAEAQRIIEQAIGG